ncbi:hypothetical protein FE783_34965 [Paenibacillus mesophilus]|uniref:amidohydrolase family protein n=1 Tax=Paenibacillus mesophilus TaxID=2582849 RepID=UPI00110D70E2|nr:amidohydrolase family protein [Paenibacillus mesophilus]TMV43597.1 hypothetical protein FE783_34965 [Paenibacillus mesophilus]
MTEHNRHVFPGEGRGALAEERRTAPSHPDMRLLEPFAAQRAIDLTAFIGQWPTRLQIRMDTAELSAMADRFGLEGVCVSHIASIFGFDTRSGNEALFKETSDDGRLWPFAILDPTEPGWELELDWAIREGARGVRLVPGYHCYSLLHPEASRFAHAVAAAGLPLHVCVRLEDERLRHPRLQTMAVPYHELAEFIRPHPAVPIVLSGLRYQEWYSISAHLNDGEIADRVLLDMWFTNGPIAAVADICQSDVSARIGYGSCAPIQTPEATVLQIAAAAIGEESRAALSRGNAARVFGLATGKVNGINNRAISSRTR